MGVVCLAGCNDTKIGYLKVDNASYGIDSLVVRKQLDPNDPDDQKKIEMEIPWLTEKIQGVLGTAPLRYELLSVSGPSVEGESVFAEASLKGSIDPFATKIYSVANLKEYHISVDSSLRARFGGGTAAIEGFSFEAFDKGGKRMAKISDAGEIGFDLQTKKISAKSKTVAKFEAADFPFAPIKPFAAGVDAESVSVAGTLSMPDESSVSASANASVKSLYYRKDGRTMFADISVKTDLEAGAALDLTRVWARAGKCVAGSGGAECGKRRGREPPPGGADATRWQPTGCKMSCVPLLRCIVQGLGRMRFPPYLCRRKMHQAKQQTIFN